MKYIKTYEKFNPETKTYEYPEKGDYVLMKLDLEEHIYSDEINNFINNNIGVIYERYFDYTDDMKVEYFNPPDIIKPWFAARNDGRYIRTMSLSNMIDFSKNKEDLELILKTNKFNV